MTAVTEPNPAAPRDTTAAPGVLLQVTDVEVAYGEAASSSPSTSAARAPRPCSPVARRSERTARDVERRPHAVGERVGARGTTIGVDDPAHVTDQGTTVATMAS